MDKISDKGLNIFDEGFYLLQAVGTPPDVCFFKHFLLRFHEPADFADLMIQTPIIGAIFEEG